MVVFPPLVALTKEELRALLAAAKAKRPDVWLMMLVGYWHGLRASEIAGLVPANIRSGFLDVARLKGSNRTIQPLVSDADPLLDEAAALIDLAASKSSVNQRLFKIGRIQFWRLVRRFGVAAGIPEHKCHPHILKHTIAMQSIQNAGVENVRQYLGHKSGNSTMAYLKVSDGEASAAVVGALRSDSD